MVLMLIHIHISLRLFKGGPFRSVWILKGTIRSIWIWTGGPF